VLFFLLQISIRPSCLFIDGLDEVDPSDGQLWLIDLLRDLQSIPRLKLCVSSRPEPLLQQYLKQFPMFKIQDLTYADIWLFASHTLRNLVRETHLNSEVEEYRHLILAICTMADGVFLWVALALRSLQNGLGKGDDLAELKQRLLLLPKDLREIYKAMWSRLGDDEEIYKHDAAIYLSLVMSRASMPPFHPDGCENAVLELLLATDTLLADRILRQDPQLLISLSDIENQCATFARRVDVRCAGFVQVVRDQPYPPMPRETRIRLIHRSAKDFLRWDETGKDLLARDQSTEGARKFNIARANIAINCLYSRLDVSFPVEGGFSNISQVLRNISREFYTEDTIHQEYSRQLASLVKSLVPGPAAESVWGRLENITARFTAQFQPGVWILERRCWGHLDFRGLALHSLELLDFDFARELILLKNDSRYNTAMTPEYRSYLFIQTKHNAITFGGIGEKYECQAEMANVLLQDGPLNPIFKTFPCICGYDMRFGVAAVPWTVVSVAIANLIFLLEIGHQQRPEAQAYVLGTITALLANKNHRAIFCNVVLLSIDISGVPPYVRCPEITISLPQEGDFDIIYRSCVFESDAKFAVTLLLDIMEQTQGSCQQTRKIRASLNEIATPDSGTVSMMTVRGDDKQGPGEPPSNQIYSTTTDPAFLSRLESLLKGIKVIGEPFSDAVCMVPGLHELAEEVEAAVREPVSGDNSRSG